MEKVGEGTCKHKWVCVKVVEVICRSKMVTWTSHIPYMESLVQKQELGHEHNLMVCFGFDLNKGSLVSTM